MVERRQHQSGPDRFDYHLTEAGRDLVPVLTALLVWGRDHAVSPDDPDRDRQFETLRRLQERTTTPDPTDQETP